MTLFSDELLSKYGFNDGNVPTRLAAYWYEIGYPYNFHWHTVLCHIVRTHLLPRLAENHTIEVRDGPWGCHNPIVAYVVDGQSVDHKAYDCGIELRPKWVDVPYEAIMTAIQMFPRDDS